MTTAQRPLQPGGTLYPRGTLFPGWWLRSPRSVTIGPEVRRTTILADPTPHGGTRMIIDPDAILDYEWDWTAWLGTDTIDSAEIILPTGDDVTLTATPAFVDAGIVTTWLSGATLGMSYRVTCRVTTTAGRTDDRTITVACRQR